MNESDITSVAGTGIPVPATGEVFDCRVPSQRDPGAAT